ncbi:MAG: hypothetical protein R3B13_01890 [Polyangiaceae bacterium]
MSQAPAATASKPPTQSGSATPKALRWRRFAPWLVVPLLLLGYFVYAWLSYPSDHTPQGAYLRVMSAVNRGKAQDLFHYTETEAQHACYTIRDFRRKARQSVLRAYPEPERGRLAAEYQPFAESSDGQDVFAIYSRQRGYLDRLRRDMSGIERVEIAGDRATVQTAKGTRYAFRRRDNGMWGLTLFTAELANEARRAARDAALVEKAAQDYERARKLGHGGG